MAEGMTLPWEIRGDPVEASRKLALRINRLASEGGGVMSIRGIGPKDGEAAFVGIRLAAERVNVVVLDRAGVAHYWHPLLRNYTPNRPTPSQVAELGFTLLVHVGLGGIRLIAETSNLPDGATWAGGLLVREAPEGLWLVLGPTFVEGDPDPDRLTPEDVDPLGVESV